MSNKVIQHWDSRSREYYAESDTQEIIEKIIQDPRIAFPRKTFELIQKHMGDLQGKRVCVPASGDNTAVFAFHLSGGQGHLDGYIFRTNQKRTNDRNEKWLGD